MRILGLDPGERRIGVALSDPTGLLASPLTVIKRSGLSDDLAAVARLVQEHEVELVVVGEPRTLRGEVGPQAEAAREFAGQLAGYVRVPVEMWDERLSTVAAEREMLALGIRAEKRRAQRDAVAAAIILQGYLDRLRWKERTSDAGGDV